MNTNRGATLVELMIAILVIMIVSLGFFNWLGTVMRMNTSIEKTNTAYAMANDVADRLQRMSNNDLIKPRSGSSRCVGYDTATADLRQCASCNTATAPTVNISVGSTGMTVFTDPWKSSAPQELYLYDRNNCEGKTWVDTTGTPTCRAGSTITATANANIDHPNSITGTPNYDSINPIRSYKGTTYYAVWSVAYLPCNADTNTDRRKIFITVYWITPEPSDTDLTALPGRIAAGTATIKSVSLVADKTIGAEK
ncbi:MAG: hypothetical protein FD156_740 [Nitrospirae bacterium]|nr:MAG: hypothetical protein FD156_740 [Nitrospirota bacterium]